ncbi:MAG: Zn-dependent hydrolase [Rhodospirillaceae bacterium]|jgi:N-carbamoyl-L-amino-acid hydrolase|nr:Zn-dependent hydrolase [Rhodospirillaceae bacterium]MBT5298212.1 Zn-dependent hydrolase [Rhodospirillaceae bacterium]MBT5515030.1 Zn-dependent hydrolase [Rhodospirillaceae bacterium]MBT6086142.1 Zn-dependent hydrolase [Rhodospirillaceae bacterium]MBT6885685.1 Zn-dependent hydrolase [Rhodospirillaceae bacterium]
MIDKDRLWQSHMEMAKIGATPRGGVCRLALSDEDKVSRDLFVKWAEEAGCTISIDTVGNIFARRAGSDADAAPVVTGSHLDTQPLGGRFDGAYGVLAGLEVVRALNDAGTTTKAPIDIVVWTDEEGCRFTTKTMGSAAFAKIIDEDAVLNGVDPDGLRFADELERIGYAGTMPLGSLAMKAYFETHIEQGPILEDEGIPVGAVVGAQGQRCFEVTVTGEEGHAGTLPMNARKDSYLGAAKMAVALNGVAFKHEPHPVITVGHVRVRPNSRNTIPGETVFTIDSRHPDDDTLSRVKDDMIRACEEIAADMGLGLEMKPTSHSPAVTFDAACVDAVRTAARDLQIPCRDMFSGAGHDACKVAGLTPTGMIFVPCKDGISHNELEDATPDDLAAGTAVLLHAVTAAANA